MITICGLILFFYGALYLKYIRYICFNINLNKNKMSNIIEELEKISSEHGIDLDDIITLAENLDNKVEDLEDKIEDLKDEHETEVEDLEGEIESLKDELSQSKCLKYPDGFNDNIVVIGVLEDLFANLNRISVDKLEAFVKRYSV